MEWVEALKVEVEASGVREVARKLGIGASTVSMIVRGVYQRSGKKVAQRVMEKLCGEVECPVLGKISKLECAKKRVLAERGALGTGNPVTLRLLKTCPKCRGKGVRK
jgi:hypothetical protein